MDVKWNEYLYRSTVKLFNKEQLLMWVNIANKSTKKSQKKNDLGKLSFSMATTTTKKKNEREHELRDYSDCESFMCASLHYT